MAAQGIPGGGGGGAAEGQARRLSRTLEGGGGSLRQSGRRGAAAKGQPVGWEEDPVAMRVQFFKNPSVFLIF